MPRSFRDRDDQPVSPAGYLPPEGSAAEFDAEYNDLLPWADPYIVSLVRGLQAATGAALAEPWPRMTDPAAGSARLAAGRDVRSGGSKSPGRRCWPNRLERGEGG